VLLVGGSLIRDDVFFGFFPSSQDSTVSSSSHTNNKAMKLGQGGGIHKYGTAYTESPIATLDKATTLEEAEEYFRHALRDVADSLYDESQQNSHKAVSAENAFSPLSFNSNNNDKATAAPLPDIHSLFVDISPLYDVVSEAIDTIGVKALFYGVFSLEGHEKSDVLAWWQARRENPNQDCQSHHGRYHCDPSQLFNLYHYIGACTVDKLQKDGSVLWSNEGGVAEYISSEKPEMLVQQMHKIDGDKDSLVDNNQMTFHSIHAIIWQFIISARPDLQQEYPRDLALKFCGDEYAYKDHYRHGKYVGRECFHGVGHAV
jgi:hypothetical protein